MLQLDRARLLTRNFDAQRPGSDDTGSYHAAVAWRQGCSTTCTLVLLGRLLTGECKGEWVSFASYLVECGHAFLKSLVYIHTYEYGFTSVIIGHIADNNNSQVTVARCLSCRDTEEVSSVVLTDCQSDSRLVNAGGHKPRSSAYRHQQSIRMSAPRGHFSSCDDARLDCITAKLPASFRTWRN